MYHFKFFTQIVKLSMYAKIYLKYDCKSTPLWS